MIEPSVLTVLVQGGAVGISLGLIWLVYKIWLRSSEDVHQMISVVEKNAKAMTALEGAITQSVRTSENLNNLITSELIQSARKSKA